MFDLVHSFFDMFKSIISISFEFLEEFVNHVCCDYRVFHGQYKKVLAKDCQHSLIKRSRFCTDSGKDKDVQGIGLSRCT